MKHASIHSNIVDVYGCYIPTQQTSTPLIVMELMDMSFAAVIRHRSILQDKSFVVSSYVFRLKLILGIVSAIKFLHAQGIIHEDIKPSNILENIERTVAKLTDFGLVENKNATCEAWDRNDTIHKTTFMNHAGMHVAGTLAYAPPEKVLAEIDAPSRAADVYSLGVTLWQCCSSLIPHAGKTDTDVNMLASNQQKSMLPFPIKSLIPSIHHPTTQDDCVMHSE